MYLYAHIYLDTDGDMYIVEVCRQPSVRLPPSRPSNSPFVPLSVVRRQQISKCGIATRGAWSHLGRRDTRDECVQWRLSLSAPRDGRLALGDELVNISGKRLRGLPVDRAAGILGEAGRDADCVVARTSPPPPLPAALEEILAMFDSRQLINLSTLPLLEAGRGPVQPTVITVGQEEEEGRAGGTYPVSDVTQVKGRGEEGGRE
jgi:hypothetical protein